MQGCMLESLLMTSHKDRPCGFRLCLQTCPASRTPGGWQLCLPHSCHSAPYSLLLVRSPGQTWLTLCLATSCLTTLLSNLLSLKHPHLLQQGSSQGQPPPEVVIARARQVYNQGRAVPLMAGL